uniref:AAA domain-containing protein n=1 Tax=Strongyloides venezuelensis TaxID=75913 RepID=A0A0K0FGU6_STRVS
MTSAASILEKDAIVEMLKAGLLPEAVDQCGRVLAFIKNRMPQPSDRENRSNFLKVYKDLKDVEELIAQYGKNITGTDHFICASDEECRCGMTEFPGSRLLPPMKKFITPKQRTVVRNPRRSGTRKSRGKRPTRQGLPAPVNILSDAPKIDNIIKGSEKSQEESNGDFMSSVPADVADVLDACLSESHNTTTWDSVVGLDDVKRSLFLNVKFAPRFRNIFKGIRQSLRTFLLYGPPGTGKTLVGKALANECGRKFLMISPSIITSKWRGDSEKIIRYIFDMAAHFAPSVLFFDELDGFCMKRGAKTEHEATRRFMSEFLVRFEELNKSEEDVCLIGATNTPWDIDPAVMRRFDVKFLVPLPCLEARVGILKNCLFELDLDESFDFVRIAKLLKGYSASDIVKISRRASLRPVEEFFATVNPDAIDCDDFNSEPYLPVSESDFTFIISITPSTVTPEMMDMYSKYNLK